MNGFAGLRCPWCHDAVAHDDEVAVCRDCLAAHHEPCWAEAGRCATCARTRPLTLQAPRAARRPAPAGWVRVLAGIAATYVVTGPLAGLLSAGLYLLGASRQDYELPYLWFFFSWFVLFMGLAGAGGLWTISRLVAAAQTLRARLRSPAPTNLGGAGRPRDESPLAGSNRAHRRAPVWN